jgi:dGTPase
MASSLEAQLVDVADQIAYNSHDVDDALQMGLLAEEQLREVPWVWEIWRAERDKLPEDKRAAYTRYRALGALMERMVNDVLDYSSTLIEKAGVATPEEVRRHGQHLICFSPKMSEGQFQLRDFLMANVYRHPITLRMTNKAAMFFHRLFDLYQSKPDMLPLEQQKQIEQWGLTRVLIDYMSDMTDRHCLEEYMDHFEPSLRWLQ